MEALVEALDSSVGIYFASFVVAVISGVFPLINSELYLLGLVSAIGDLEKLIVLGVIIGVGQTVAHSFLYLAAHGVIKLGEKRRKKLEARIERARGLVEKRRGHALVVLALAATFGLPPMLLVSLVAGSLGIRFRTYLVFALIGRILRFTTIAVFAELI